MKILRLGTLSDEECMAFFSFDSICQPAMHRHPVTYLSPTHINAALFQIASNTVQQVISKQRDENVCITSILFLMKNRAHEKFRLKRSKGILQLCQHDVD